MDKESNFIAVIGLWCRFPGAESPEAFWINLCNGKESIVKISRQELLSAGVSPALIDNEDYVPYRGLLQNAAYFDASSFRITPAEAELTDPQHRQFLECAHLALEDSGLNKEALKNIGVFATQSRNAYRENCHPFTSSVNAFSADIFNGAAHLATNVAYRLGANGPAITVQSACSSSLVAIHLACQALRDGDCDIAIAGGVSIGWPQHVGHMYVPDGIMSRDGRCCPFDAESSGTVRGEGVGIVVLQKLDSARAEYRHIKAIIRGSAVNNDGASRMGFTTPSAKGQIRVIHNAMKSACVSAEDISFIETHGTGTAVGDAIELSALAEAMHMTTPDKDKIWLGAVKANIGHLDAAAGIAGLIKVVLALSHRKITPQVGFTRLHENSTSYASQFAIPVRQEKWESSGTRVASVSSFGLGGTNAHVILEEYCESKPAVADADNSLTWVFPLVARDEDALSSVAASILAHGKRNAFRALDVAYSMAIQASTGCQRSVAFGADIAALTMQGATHRPLPSLQDSVGRVIVILGGLWVLSSKALSELRRTIPTFHRHFEAVANKVKQVTGIDPRLNEVSDEPFKDVQDAAPANRLTVFCMQIAAVRTLVAVGLEITAMAAEGAGECAAACIDGALTIEEGAMLVRCLANGAPLKELRELLNDIPKRHTERLYFTTLRQRVSIEDRWDAQRWKAIFGGEVHSAAPSAALNQTDHLIPIVLGELSKQSELTFGDAINKMATLALSGPSIRNQFQRVIAIAWLHGASVNWSLLFEGHEARAITLPSQPLNRMVFVPPVSTRGTNSSIERTTTHAEIIPRVSTQVQLQSLQWLEETVRDSFAQVLQISGVRKDDNFFDMGGCSLTALDILDLINTATGIRISLRVFLHTPSVSAVAAELVRLSGNFQEIAHALPSAQTREGSRFSLSPACATASASSGADASGLLNFSVFFFSGEAPEHAAPNNYGLLLEAARLADDNDFEAIWVPERHFHKFGGLFPAPAVLGGALAVATRRISIRAGSVVLPLHDPLDVVEQWAVVDNLSGGRVGIAVAPGFHPTDFMIQPSRFDNRRKRLHADLKTVRRLWRGEIFEGPDGLGRSTQVVTLPRPIQAELPVWITASDSEQSFEEAGAVGANVLTALLSLDINALAGRIAIYRKALGSRRGKVTVMLHTYVHPDPEVVASVGVRALNEYLQTHLGFASTRTTYEKVTQLAESDQEALVEHAVMRYLNGASLIGTPAQCEAFARKLSAIGVDEIACLIDFGVPHGPAISSLKEVVSLQTRIRAAY